jgi:hypothetical protein
MLDVIGFAGKLVDRPVLRRRDHPFVDHIPISTFLFFWPFTLSQITENREAEARNPLIFQYSIFGFCPQKATLRQSLSSSVVARAG